MSAILIENGTLIDGTGAEPRPLGALLVDGDEIIAVGPEAEEASAARGGATRIDASGCTVMPGLIDAHCHVTFAEPQSNDELFFHRREGLAAIVATQSVRKLLLAGVTSFFDADVLFNLGVDLRDSIEAGVIPGPRMATGGNALLTAVGGTAGLLIPDEGRRGYAAVVNNREEMVTATRRQIKSGVDWIKVHATGLIPRQRARGEIQVWTLEELQTVAKTAHDLGIPVVAHCRNASSTRDAARAGFDMILHATHMDEEALEAVVESGCSLVPTLTFQANLADFGHKVGATPELIELFRTEIDESSGMLRKAFDAGVPLVSGSESGFAITPYGHWHAREMEVFVKHLGLTPLQAIRTATLEGARAMKMEGEVGEVAVGKRADLIVVEGDPVQDIRILGDRTRLRAVISRGQSVDLDVDWPTRSALPGEKVGVWSTQALTWQRANDLGDAG